MFYALLLPPCINCTAKVIFSIMSVCGCLLTRWLLNRLRCHHERFMGARCGQKLGRVRKWLHCDALRHSAGDVQVYKMYRYINPWQYSTVAAEHWSSAHDNWWNDLRRTYCWKQPVTYSCTDACARSDSCKVKCSVISYYSVCVSFCSVLAT